MKRETTIPDEFIDGLVSCTYSEQGCKLSPVRMLAELPPQISITGKPVEAEMVMLCRLHAVTYVPSHPVIFDHTISAENIEFMTKHGL